MRGLLYSFLNCIVASAVANEEQGGLRICTLRQGINPHLQSLIVPLLASVTFTLGLQLYLTVYLLPGKLILKINDQILVLLAVIKADCVIMLFLYETFFCE